MVQLLGPRKPEIALKYTGKTAPKGRTVTTGQASLADNGLTFHFDRADYFRLARRPQIEHDSMS